VEKKSVYLLQDLLDLKDKNKPLDFTKEFRPLEFWESAADYYSQLYNKKEMFFQNTAWVLQKLDIAKPKSILDVGCGFGRLEPFIVDGLKENAPERVVGIDFCQRMIELATEYLKDYPNKDKIKLLMVDARALPYKDNEFDCIVTSELFTHMKFNDAQKAANEIKRVAGKYIFCMERYIFDGEHPEPHVFSWDINKFFRLKVLERKLINQGIVGTVLEKS